MTIEEFDSRVRESGSNPWILDPTTGYSYMWTGYKRKYDPRLMTQAYEEVDDGVKMKRVLIPLEPIDDSLVGQWCGGLKEMRMAYYASVPGGSGTCNLDGQVLDCEVKPGQTALTIHSSPDLLEHCRKEGFARLIVMMEKLGAIEGPNFPELL